MGKCLDSESCGYENRDPENQNRRFCERCGIPLRGILLQGRYEIQRLLGKDRGTVTLRGYDIQQEQPVTVRALIPRESSQEEQENFLQDAELAAALSARINEPGSITVIGYGQDGPLAFLVKAELGKARQAAPASGGITATRSVPQSQQIVEEDMSTQLRIAVPPGLKITTDSVPPVTSERKNNPFTPLPLTIPVAQPRDWLAEGNFAYELGDYPKALSSYETALQENIVLVDAWSGKGATLLGLGRADEALLAYDHAISLKPNDPELWNSRATALHELQRYDEEMTCYDQALRYDPNYVYAWSGKGMALAERGEAEEALIAFDRALVLNPRQSIVWQAMGDTLYSLQRYNEALLAINKAIELDAGRAALWDTKGNILRRMKNPEQALPLHERATQLDPENATSWFDKGNDLRDLRRFAEALNDYDQALAY
ncbi:MAG TPA: tetratricopeptide repeat protein, partial [Ktedonobacteraceae bacterium]